jgi:hypothetical protein
MSTRRKRAKAQANQLNRQLEPATVIPKERKEQVVELGKFFIDLAKLIFGGVILTVLLDYQSYKMPLLMAALVSLVMLVTFGYQVIRYGNRK